MEQGADVRIRQALSAVVDWALRLLGETAGEAEGCMTPKALGELVGVLEKVQRLTGEENTTQVITLVPRPQSGEQEEGEAR